VTRLEGARVLVTGAGGFVGPHLVRALAARGASVRGAGLGSPPAGTPLADWREADFSILEQAEAAVAAAPVDAIVHLAGQSSAAQSFNDPEATFRANVNGTWSLLEAARTHAPGARVLVVGTSEVYGSIAPGTRAAETHAFVPASPYALSKAAAEHLAIAYATSRWTWCGRGRSDTPGPARRRASWCRRSRSRSPPSRRGRRSQCCASATSR
jgi:nucleoside-diphosphate-sugar epimerase